MKLSQAYKTLELAHSINAATIMWGGPGLGKSSLAHQFAQDKKLAIIDWRLTLMDSVDMRGTPFRDKDGFTVWAPPAELPRRAASPGSSSSMSFPKLAWKSRTSPRCWCWSIASASGSCPKGWWMLAAGNRMGDAAGTSPMPTHLNNRFWHRRRSLSHDWLIGRGEHDLDYRVHRLDQVPAEALLAFRSEEQGRGVRHASHLARVSDIMKNLGTEHEGALARRRGALRDDRGQRRQGARREFVGFMRVMHQLVTFGEILSNPDTAKISDRAPSVQYAVVTGLTRAVDKKSIANAFATCSGSARRWRSCSRGSLRTSNPSFARRRASRSSAPPTLITSKEKTR
jgi:hypothetical protein